jgi:hypothetical protein
MYMVISCEIVLYMLQYLSGNPRKCEYLCVCMFVCVVFIGYGYMQTVIHILVEFIWSLPVPAIEFLEVARVARASVGCCTVAIYAAILTHWHADLPMSCEASVAYT